MDTRTKLFMVLFGLVGLGTGGAAGYIAGPYAYTDLESWMGSNTDGGGTAALFAWCGGLSLALVGGLQGRALGQRLRKRDKARARRERYANVLANYEQTKSERPEDREDADPSRDARRYYPWQRRKKPFSPWP